MFPDPEDEDLMLTFLDFEGESMDQIFGDGHDFTN